jgi:hypothetical protein
LPETCWATIRREIQNTKKWHLVGFSYPHWITMHGQPHIRFIFVFFFAYRNHSQMCISVWFMRSASCASLSGDELFQRIQVKIGFSFMWSITNHFMWNVTSRNVTERQKGQDRKLLRARRNWHRKRGENEGEKIMEKWGRAGKYRTEWTGKWNKGSLVLCTVSIESHRNC